MWCVKHKDGWCATADNKPWNERDFNVKTLCNHQVILPLGCKNGQPSCDECLRALANG